MEITSAQNPRIKHIVKLRDDRRQRQHDGLILVEGKDEIQLALATGHEPQVLVQCPEISVNHTPLAPGELLSVTLQVFKKLSYRENPDGWIAVFPTPHSSLSDLKLGDVPLLVVAESVEKPGNLGAILRTADAAGADAVLVCDPRVDTYNPNVIRASRGTIFSVPTVDASSAEALQFLRQQGVRILAAAPGASEPYTSADLRGPIAIAVGTEDAGLTPFWLDEADAQVLIPMRGKVNSLNVSIATALILYEAVRQRSV
jgi:RNA methyltransferase, TrmH family